MKQLDFFEKKSFIQYDNGYCTNGCGIISYPVNEIVANTKNYMYMIRFMPNCPGEYVACKDCRDNF